MIGTGLVVGVYPGRDGVDIAPGHDGVDEAVTARSGQVLVVETERSEVVGDTGKRQVTGGERPGRLAGLNRIPFEHHRDLGSETRSLPQRFPGARAVCLTGNAAGVRPRGAVACQGEHAGTERRQHVAILCHRAWRIEGVECIEVAHHVRVGVVVVLGERRMAGTEAQD